MLLYLQDRKVRFFIVGGCVFVFGFVAMKILVDLLHINESVAFAIVSFLSIETNFAMNYYWTWKESGKGVRNLMNKWMKFHTSKVFSIILNQMLFNVLVKFDLHYLISMIITTGLSTMFNYIAAEYFVFREKKA